MRDMAAGGEGHYPTVGGAEDHAQQNHESPTNINFAKESMQENCSYKQELCNTRINLLSSFRGEEFISCRAIYQRMLSNQ